MKLPQDFIDELRVVLGDDTERYISLSDGQPYRGISVNRLKTTPETLLPLLPFETKRSPFYSDGYYIPSEAEGVGSHPLHHAGAFYVQEPSASCAAELLEIQAGDRVLDLCAAPGGKSAQIASILGGSGLIWSNEVVKSRANILLSNFERMGISAGVVSSCMPDVLCTGLEGFFNRVLVDAPCSGEGMFRKEEAALSEWSRAHVLSCASRQLSILKSAVSALKPGGVLVYSTCTFSPEENEMTAEAILRECPELEPYDIEDHPGRRTRLPYAVRITPLEGGEGHFAARFCKKGERIQSREAVRRQSGKPSAKDRIINDALEDIFRVKPDMQIIWINDRAYLVPEGLPELSGLGVIRAGVFAGELVKNRFEPAHHLFTAFPPSAYRRVLELPLSDDRLYSYLSGAETDCDGDKGYTAVSVQGITLGFGKCSGGRLKNKYPKGLRITGK